MNISIINGPNLNLLALREKDIYGEISFESFYSDLKKKYPDIHFSYFQSNIEGELINELHNVGFNVDAIILNAAGYTHTSVSIADAILVLKTPVIEVHISNIYAREEFRKNSLISKSCKGSISGFGLYSYILAVEAAIAL